MTLESPRLWFPDAPNLYVLCTEIIENGKVLDREETRIGIRKLEMTREKGFVINGKPIRLVGSNRHMEYPYIGNALSDNAQYRDMHQIRSNGFNLVRLGHYPQDVSVLDACDELGLLVIEPIPGWQYFNKASLFTELTYRDVRHLIRRDRNHPSIVMWETTLNEAWPPKEWKNGAVKVAHEEYPGNQCFTSGDSYGYEGFDVCYNDWEEGFKRPNKTGKPGFIREYYDYEFGGHYSTTRIRRGDGEMAQLQNAWNAQWSHTGIVPIIPRLWGMPYGVCTITTVVVVIIFVIAEWPICSDYPNLASPFLEPRFRPVVISRMEKCLTKYSFRLIVIKSCPLLFPLFSASFSVLMRRIAHYPPH